MAVGIKDIFKLIGIIIVTACAAFVCSMFVSFAIDLAAVKDLVVSEAARYMFDAQMNTAKVVCYVTGGCLTLTTFGLLIFYLKNYIDKHGKELGILKAMGYTELKIAASFTVFGLSVFIGCVIGFLMSRLIMPSFYAQQNADKILPEILPKFHAITLLIVAIPTVLFSVVAFLYSFKKLKRPVMELIKGRERAIKIAPQEKKELPFVKELRRATVKSNKTSVVFIAFSAFCFSAMTQMAVSMIDLASEMMALMILIIGLILAVMSLLMSLSAVLKGNAPTVAIMRAFGYTDMQCANVLLGGYTPFALAGFAVGSVYQYGLLKLMVEIVFKNVSDIAGKFDFDFAAFAISLFSFAAFYIAVAAVCYFRIKKLSLR